MSPPLPPVIERRVVELRGLVQGVGFRPFVYRLANRHGLHGAVRNGAGGVLIDVEGAAVALRSFLAELAARPPAAARIASLAVTEREPVRRSDFRIETSDAAADCWAGPDLATCDACLAELFDPADRRYRYPFIACAECGPRYTMARGLPYDRERTAMAPFPMCGTCRAEYENPADRRFHAESIACGHCGPAISLLRPDGVAITGSTALDSAVAALSAGLIVAVKGAGGYHLSCDATDGAAVARLRRRKGRDARPFALMVQDLEAACALALVDDAEAALLGSPERPIVLLAARLVPRVAAAISPGLRDLGIMLPYTPLHHLLLRAAGRPLVMTSGNRSDEPMAHRNDHARERLGTIADVFLTHDREIEHRCDDSVARVVAGARRLLRRARGFAPAPLGLRERLPHPILAVGGHLKSTFCLARSSDAFLSPHIGDLDHPDARNALRDGIRRQSRLLDLRPEWIVHDLHPDYHSTRLAEELAPPERRIAVQHHHAHVVACQADCGVTGPVIGVALDGAGLGDDGAIWGGEFLVVEGSGYRRAGHLAYVPLAGGDAAAREPWRMAVAHLWSAFGAGFADLPLPMLEQIPAGNLSLLGQMLARGVNAPPTSSMGRLFDAVAALAGIATVARYEGQPAAELEAAAGTDGGSSYSVDFDRAGDCWRVRTEPMIREITHDVLRGRGAAAISATFHRSMIEMVATMAGRIAKDTKLRRVALTGGVFQNRRLLAGAARALSARGFDVLLHHRVPCNDGGLSLGQAVVAGRQLAGKGGG